MDDTTWPSLLSALAEHDPALSHRAAVGRAGGQLARSRGFFGELVRTRVQQLVDFLEESAPGHTKLAWRGYSAHVAGGVGL